MNSLHSFIYSEIYAIDKNEYTVKTWTGLQRFLIISSVTATLAYSSPSTFPLVLLSRLREAPFIIFLDLEEKTAIHHHNITKSQTTWTIISMAYDHGNLQAMQLFFSSEFALLAMHSFCSRNVITTNVRTKHREVRYFQTYVRHECTDWVQTPHVSLEDVVFLYRVLNNG